MTRRKRKFRVVVEVTLDPDTCLHLTERFAKQCVDMALERAMNCSDHFNFHVTAWECKQYSRVRVAKKDRPQ